MPSHKNPTTPRRTAIAPYNFVEVADPPFVYPDQPGHSRQVDQSRYHGNRLTGWIDVELETKSPLYIRGGLTPAEYEQMERQENYPEDRTPHLEKLRNKPDFFYTDNPNEPVIPGSSLRGMLRTLAQILGYGKLSPVSDTPLVYRAVADMSRHGEAYRQLMMAEEPSLDKHYTPRFRGGYIEKDTGSNRWVIRPAQEIGGATYARIPIPSIPHGLQRWHDCRNAYHIYIEAGPCQFQKVRGGFIHVKFSKVLRASDKKSPDLIAAVLARSGSIPKKASEAVIFPPDEKAAVIPIPDGGDEDDNRDLITAYRDQMSPEQKKLLGNQGVLQEKHPIFYVLDEQGRLKFFGHTQMFRMPYPRSPRKMLHPLHYDDNVLDLAESVFGVARGQQGGHAGRVFISDARRQPEQGSPWLSGERQVLIPQILSGPKPTTFQHYLTQSRPDDEKGGGLTTYNDSPQRTTLRGFKFYWHKGPKHDFVEKGQVDEQKDTQHTRIKPVRDGQKFQFRVRFENLRLDELGLLWWCLELPVPGGTYVHKLGMGKPLGLGAVRLSPTLTVINPGVRYQSLLGEESAEWVEAVIDKESTQNLRDRAVRNFENLMLQANKRPGSQFAQLERVRQLLSLLSWPGPNPELTRYMEIERPDQTKRGKHNEYRERPVLPDPTQVK